MPIPNDPRLLDIACHVTIRFRGTAATVVRRERSRRLGRRAPGYTPGEYLAVFAFFLAVYDRAVEVIPRHLAHRPDKATNLAEFEDIDFDACMANLNEIEPGLAAREKGWILNWCIFWHH